jgi:hypothetical protein
MCMKFRPRKSNVGGEGKEIRISFKAFVVD